MLKQQLTSQCDNSSRQQLLILGQAPRAIKQIDIHWPASGIDQTIKKVAMDRFYKIREGDTTAEPWNVSKIQLKMQHH